MPPTGYMTRPPHRFTGAAWFRRKVAQLGAALQRLPLHRRNLRRADRRGFPPPSPQPAAWRSQHGGKCPTKQGEVAQCRKNHNLTSGKRKGYRED